MRRDGRQGPLRQPWLASPLAAVVPVRVLLGPKIKHSTGAGHRPQGKVNMNPETIGEAWQAMSVLSDAQELLAQTQAATRDSRLRLERSNDLINHAKRHLMRLFDLAREEDQDAFLRGTLGLECTLQDVDEEQHEEMQVLVCPLTVNQVGELFDGYVSGLDWVPVQWHDLAPEHRQEVIDLAKDLLYVDDEGMRNSFEDVFRDRLGPLLFERHWWVPGGGI